jgi:hypothetical protein
MQTISPADSFYYFFISRSPFLRNLQSSGNPKLSFLLTKIFAEIIWSESAFCFAPWGISLPSAKLIVQLWLGDEQSQL